MMTSGTRVALKSADLVIVPDLKGLTGSDWRRTADLAAQGYKAAEAQASDLLKYQVDEATYAEWTRARTARRKADPPSVSRIIVEGAPEVETTHLTKVLETRHLGKPLVRDELEDSILRISGTDRYEIIAL